MHWLELYVAMPEELTSHTVYIMLRTCMYCTVHTHRFINVIAANKHALHTSCIYRALGGNTLQPTAVMVCCKKEDQLGSA